MNLYLIEQNEAHGWDTYDSAVVAAMTNKKARKTHPGTYNAVWSSGAWASTPDKVTATFIGKAVKGTLPRVICSSYNAG